MAYHLQENTVLATRDIEGKGEKVKEDHLREGKKVE